ncbi:MAG: hypothetical protein EAZ57_06995 [Cytophagales bacterium]|nr:MAG: hypothetical protein EAZ67_07540 [Cytophagales bacterium]TAF60600.1 MAG: hypothetical protein EAZ57_06995 [Cytophagales bacterium]
MKKLFFLLALLLSFFGGAFAQNNSVLIKDATNQEPLQGVYVMDDRGLVIAISDAQGRVNLANVNQTLELTFSHSAFFTERLVASEALSKGEINLTEKLFEQEEVVVTGSRNALKRAETPNQILSISAKNIAFTDPQTSADLLSRSGEIYVQKSQQGGGSPMIRGFNANAVLIVIDGVRMNNAIFRGGNLQNVIQLDANSMEQAEVLFGPGSVMYGSDALGGVMNFQTYTPKFSSDGKVKLSAQALTRYASANSEHTAHAHWNLATKRLAWFSSVSFSDFGDMQMGKQNVDSMGMRLWYVERMGDTDIKVRNSKPYLAVNSGYNQHNIVQKLTFKLSETAQLAYALHYSNSSDIPRYDRLIQDDRLTQTDPTKVKPSQSEWYYGPQTWRMHQLGLTLTNKNRAYDRLRLSIAQQYMNESRITRGFNSNNKTTRIETVNVWNINLDLDKKLSSKSDLFYGVEAVMNDVQSEASRFNIKDGKITPASTRYPSGGSTQNFFAAYVQNKTNFGEKVTLTSGLRYSHYWLNGKFSDTTFFKFPYKEATVNAGAFNASLGINYRPTESTQINANLASGFRAPNVDDIGKVFDSNASVGRVVVPNPNLSPEYTYNAEVGIAQKLANRVTISLTAYYTLLNQKIVLRPGQFNGQDSILYDGTKSQVETFTNDGKGYIAGVHTEIQTDITKFLAFRTTLTYTTSQDQSVPDQTLQLQATPPMFGMTSLMFKMKKVRAEFWMQYQAQSVPFSEMSAEVADKSFLYSGDTQPATLSQRIPAWWTANLRTSYQFNRHLQLNFAAENLLDRFYLPYGSGIPSMGRNIVVSLRANI